MPFNPNPNGDGVKGMLLFHVPAVSAFMLLMADDLADFFIKN
jgi:hypothetical protein